MGLSLANPLALGLLGLIAVPLIVHLLARGEYRVVPVGSLRWLQAQQQSRWSRVQLHDPWRLLLRLLLVLTAVLALAEPHWVGSPRPPQLHVLVDPLAESASVREALDRLTEDPRGRGMALDVRALAPGLPAWPGGAQYERAPPLYSLLEAADAQMSTGPVVVLANTQAHRLGWRRPTLSREVRWVPLPARAGNSSALPPARNVAVVHEDRADVAAWVGAAVRAWAAAGRRVGDRVSVYTIDEFSTMPPPDWLVWLGQGETLPGAIAAAADAGVRVLSDTPGDAQSSMSIDDPGGEPRSFTRVRAPRGDEVPVLRAISGEVVLVGVPGRELMRLLGPVDSSADGLLASSRFPTWLLDLLGERWRSPVREGLMIAAGQALPTWNTASSPVHVQHPLASYLLTLLLLLWLGDRAWSLLRPRVGAPA